MSGQAGGAGGSIATNDNVPPHGQHSRVASEVSQLASPQSATTSIEVVPILGARDEALANTTPSSGSLGSPRGQGPTPDGPMKRGIRRHMENGTHRGSGGAVSLTPRPRVAVRAIGGSFHNHSSELVNRSSGSSSTFGMGAGASGPLPDSHSGSVSGRHVAPYWQNTQQYIPRTLLQYSSSPSQQMLRAATPNVQMHGPTSISGFGNDTSMLFTPPPPADSGSATTPSNMPMSCHQRGLSLMEPPTQQALVPPYDAAALSASATIGDYIMGHSPVGHVGPSGHTSSFEDDANDAVREYTDAIRRRQRSPSGVRSAQYRPLPILFDTTAPRSSPWQFPTPSDRNESSATDDPLDSSSARMPSPAEQLTDSLQSPSGAGESEPPYVPDALAHTQRPAQVQRAVPHRPPHRGAQARRSSLHICPRSLSYAAGHHLTLSQSQPSLGVAPFHPTETPTLSPGGGVAPTQGTYGSHTTWQHQRAMSGVSPGRGPYPWDTVTASAPFTGPGPAQMGASGVNGFTSVMTGTPTVPWMRNAEQSFAGYSRGGPDSNHSVTAAASPAERLHIGDMPQGGQLTPGSVEVAPLPVGTTHYEELSDLLDVCRLFCSDVENVYGVVPASQHTLQLALVNVLTALTMYFSAFYAAFCAVSSPTSSSCAVSPVHGEPQSLESRPLHSLSPSLKTLSNISGDQYEASLELANELICDLQLDLLPSLLAFTNVEKAMQETRRRKELVAFWASEVIAAMVRELNSALMAAAGDASNGAMPGESAVCPRSQTDNDASGDVWSMTTTAASAATQPQRASPPGPTAFSRAQLDENDVLSNTERLADWLSESETLRKEIEVTFPQLEHKYVVAAVEMSVLTIALEFAEAQEATEPREDSSVATTATGTTNFSTSLARIVERLTAEGSEARAAVEVNTSTRALPTMDEIQNEFSNLSDAAAWSWWYSRQELYFAAPRTQSQCQRDRTAAVKKYCEQSDDATPFFRAVATNALWCEQAREQKQLTAAQLENVTDALKQHGESLLRMILRHAIVRYVLTQPGVCDARSPAEALAAQLYRHFASVQSTLSELTQTSTDMGHDASTIARFVHAATHALDAYNAGVTPSADVPQQGEDESQDTEGTVQRDLLLKGAEAQRRVDAFVAAFTADAASQAPESSASVRSGAPLSPSVSSRRSGHPLLGGEGQVLPPCLSSPSARCAFIKSVHSACVAATQQISTMLQSSHYAILRDEWAQQIDAATARTTLPLFNQHGPLRYVQSLSHGRVDPSGSPTSSWDAPRPSTRALNRLHQSLLELYASLDRNRYMLDVTLSKKPL